MYPTLRMAVRALVGGALVAMTAVMTGSGAASAATTCNIVQNPTDQNYTTCPGADLQNANLSNLDLTTPTSTVPI